MIVTQITQLSKNRYKVYLDYEFAFVLYKGELCQYGIAEGAEIKEEDYDVIMHTLLPKRAKLRALNLLQKKSYTEKQLRDKLAEGCYTEEIINNAVAYVKSFRYIDDYQYALDYLTYHAEYRTIRKIEQELYGKGIGKEIFSKVLSAWEENGEKQDVQGMIFAQLEKKKYHIDSDMKEKQKIYAYLLRKGYPSEEISKAMQLERFEMCK